MSFKKFLGLESGDKVPDEKTVWAFRETLTSKGLIEKLFVEFRNYLEAKGRIMNEGKMIDASFTVAPRQRNTKDENKLIKEGRGDELWNDNPNKKRHKDLIRLNLKALIGRNIFGMEAFFPVIHQRDLAFRKALEVLNSDRYHTLLEPVNQP